MIKSDWDQFLVCDYSEIKKNFAACKILDPKLKPKAHKITWLFRAVWTEHAVWQVLFRLNIFDRFEKVVKVKLYAVLFFRASS